VLYRLKRFFYLQKQYTLREYILLIFSLFLDSIIRRIPEYLMFTKNSFDRYYESRILSVRRGDVNTLHYQDFKIDLRRDSSDFLVFDQVILEDGLAPVINLIKEKKISINKILDCGANIGLTSLYLNSNLPEAKILALEPEPDNFKQLLANVAANKPNRITPVQIGVWSKKALLEHDVNFCYAKGWAFSLRESEVERGSIAVDSIPNILVDNNFTDIDYLKMDIEGSEFELFRNIQTWQHVLDRLKIITIEIHEKRGSVFEIVNILELNGFKLNKFGELLTAWRV
jgi:FkbM family methyltransferase